MRDNPLDVARKAMTDSYLQAQAAIKSDLEGTTPYNSVKLSDVQERMMYDHPERILPGGVGDPAMAHQALKEKMGAAEYASWIKRMGGGV